MPKRHYRRLKQASPTQTGLQGEVGQARTLPKSWVLIEDTWRISLYVSEGVPQDWHTAQGMARYLVYQIFPTPAMPNLGASPIWDNTVSHLHRSFNAETIPKHRHRQVAQIVACQFQGALAANPALGIVRERLKAVQLLEYTQENLRQLLIRRNAEGVRFRMRVSALSRIERHPVFLLL